MTPAHSGAGCHLRHDLSVSPALDSARASPQPHLATPEPRRIRIPRWSLEFPAHPLDGVTVEIVAVFTLNVTSLDQPAPLAHPGRSGDWVGTDCGHDLRVAPTDYRVPESIPALRSKEGGLLSPS